MKKTKNYIDPDLAKRKIARHRYWSIKDDNGITIVTAEDEGENRTFNEVLDKVVADNVDSEVQVKYGTTEQSARKNPPLFIKINEEIEWVESEIEEEAIERLAYQTKGSFNEVADAYSQKFDETLTDRMRKELDSDEFQDWRNIID